MDTRKDTGTFQPPPGVMETKPAVVRVMTWNIHGSVGLDGQRDRQRIVDFIRRQDPDIIALQEVGSRKSDPAAQEDFAFFASALGNHAIESRLITAPDGNYGHAIISRWPLRQTCCHDISYRRREPRAAIEATTETPSGTLHIVAAHLGLSFAERRHQTRLLAALVRSGPEPTVLLGDLNDWLGRGSVQTTLNALFPGHSHLKTFPSFYPLFPLDRVYCRPRTMLLESWTDPAARIASDHLPVIATIGMKHDGENQRDL
ncbi:endonuclease/exonuclease/phosphatase family protein [Chelativorans sp. YIM 93263]|uniref:endonuclease/exonuclease/phosphatase family protein n=1 Tax=Chelativorans sp. YIM 93263 TaxID=2906648 RepID=UPI00237884DD|nr:endonuclease/exonuclease/phosphatase family protein [Chelativorans sp. YIM 93263]